MPDDVAGEPVRRACRRRWVAPGEAGGEIAGIEAVAGGRSVDRHHHLRHRHEFLTPGCGDERAVGAVLDHDLADAEGLQPGDRRLRARVAPEHRLIVESRQRDVHALERFDEDGARAREVPLPAARPEVAVEGHLGALLARGFEQREEAAKAVVGIKRQGDAGKVDEPRRQQRFGDPHPVGVLEQVARWRALAPRANVTFSGRTVFNEAQSRQPSGHAQHEMPGNTFGGGKRHDALGIGIIAKRRGEGHINAGAGEINGGIERIAAAGQCEPAVGPARQFDQYLAHADGAGPLAHRFAFHRGKKLPRVRK
jgi:hypothetical protein